MGGEKEEEEEEDDDVEEEGRSQNREAHFVRACAVDMHTDMLQERHFVWGLCQSRDTCFFPSQRSRNAHGHFTRAILLIDM